MAVRHVVRHSFVPGARVVTVRKADDGFMTIVHDDDGDERVEGHATHIWGAIRIHDIVARSLSRPNQQ